MAAREKKLLLHEKLEVRSIEDGFLGSWHSGVVRECGDLVRVVQYDHILCDDGTNRLIEQVKVTPAIDGLVDKETKNPGEYRGLIRPLPPSCDIGLWSLHYGQCVDLLHMDAWWEGVVFDHEDGSERRRIFFPDLGDEIESNINGLRLSMDWDEITEEWKPRGNWLFLELIEEVEREWPLLVSVRQIWYEVRMKNGFEKLKEWTSSKRELWKELMTQVFSDNLKITVKQLFTNMDSFPEPGQSSIGFSEKVFDSVLKSEELFHSYVPVLPFEVTSQSDEQEILQTDVSDKNNYQVQEKNVQIPSSVRLTNEQTPPCCRAALPILFHNPDENSAIGSNNYDTSPNMSLELQEEHKNKRTKWQLAVAHYEAEYLPDAIDECNKIYRSNKKSSPPKQLRLQACKQLVHLGWKIECARDDGGKGMIRKRYISPAGDVFYSFVQVCKTFGHDIELGPGSEMLMNQNYRIGHNVSSSEETLSHPGKLQASRELSKSCTHSDMLDIVPEHCPEAVRDYYLLCSREKVHGGRDVEGRLKTMKVKKHLSATGWTFHYRMRQNRRELCYTSPTGKSFSSLASACKWLLDCSLTPLDLTAAVGRAVDRNHINDIDDNPSTSKLHLPLISMDSPQNLPDKFGVMQPSDMPMPEEFVQSIEVEAYKTRMSMKRKMHNKSHCVEGSLPHRKGRKSHASMRLRRDSNAESPTPFRRSSKRVRDRDASSTQKTPRTVLSWLIENNVILPRAKVEYRSRKNGSRMAEGRITREGIKCSCCGVIFSLSKFEAHAGSTDHKPSANIFLEDGRSLLECQLQLKQHSSNRSLRLECENKGTRHNRRNDCICSVCHYGGELVLCDQCPSSFHTQCVGLKEVPDGDWFCPSCSCQICTKSGFNKGNRLTSDSSFLICGQCERRYHAGCLEKKENKNCNSEGDWFCHDTCQQIFHGLHGILGKKIPVGTENLTWSLVKYIESDFSKHDAPDDEGLVEGYSKLNVALSVMHECFEPVKEPRTKRDLMEDVIFNRWSELNRLNFQGFYTVILEKDDEMVSVATVRIYGKRVAEVPLVATRFHHRRLGMCRILMDELEKRLAQLGVERLVLPAIPSVLHTWTTSFGFSKMNESERLNFLDYTFLDFQGTVLCQKVLNNNLSVVSTQSAEIQVNSRGNVYNNVNIGVDEIGAVPEVLERKQVADSDIVEQESTCIETVVGNANAGCYAETITVVDQSTLPSCSPFQLLLECPPIVATNGNENAGCSTEAVIVVDQPELPDCLPFQPPLDCPEVAETNEKGDGGCSDETVIVVNQPTLQDLLPFQTPVECPATNDKKLGNNRDGGVLKCYKRRRIAACQG